MATFMRALAPVAAVFSALAAGVSGQASAAPLAPTPEPSGDTSSLPIMTSTSAEATSTRTTSRDAESAPAAPDTLRPGQPIATRTAQTSTGSTRETSAPSTTRPDTPSSTQEEPTRAPAAPDALRPGQDIGGEDPEPSATHTPSPTTTSDPAEDVVGPEADSLRPGAPDTLKPPTVTGTLTPSPTDTSDTPSPTTTTSDGTPSETPEPTTTTPTPTETSTPPPVVIGGDHEEMKITTMSVSSSEATVEGLGVATVTVRVGANFGEMQRLPGEGLTALFAVEGEPDQAPLAAYLSEQVEGGPTAGVWQGVLQVPSRVRGQLRLTEVVGTSIPRGITSRTPTSLVEGPTVEARGSNAPRIEVDPQSGVLPLGGKNYEITGRLLDAGGSPYSRPQPVYLQVNRRTIRVATTDDAGRFRFLVHDSESVPENSGWLRLQPQRIVAFSQAGAPRGGAVPLAEARVDLKVSVPVTAKASNIAVVGARPVQIQGRAVGSGACMAVVERLSGGTWSAHAAPVPVAGNGSFSATVTPATGRNNTYRVTLSDCNGVRRGTSSTVRVYSAR